jgi:diacylglycerol kinase family enzyme
VKHIFIVNPRHFQKKSSVDRILYQIESDFHFGKVADYEINISRYRRDSIGFLHKRINELGSDEVARVYAVGGDGTLFDCLNGIINTNAELACVPHGWSDFIRTFGDENTHIFRNVARQINAPVIPVDIFSCNENYAINYCAIGFDGGTALIANEIINFYKNILSFLPNYKRNAYRFGRVFSFFKKSIREQHYTVTIDGEDYSGNYSEIFIANGKCYDYNKTPASRARITDGKLDVFFVKSMGLPEALFKWRSFQNGKLTGDSRLPSPIRAENIYVESGDGPLHVLLDGSAFYESKLNIKIHPQALNFVVPNTVQVNAESANV